jgi:midasin
LQARADAYLARAGGDGPGEFKEAEGTGLGEGTGAKDISDQLTDQDQLLGAQQRGKQEQPEQPEQQASRGLSGGGA